MALMGDEAYVLSKKYTKKESNENTKIDGQTNFSHFQNVNNQMNYPMTYDVIGDRHLLFKIGIGENEFAEYGFQKNPTDDFIKFWDVNLTKPTETEIINKDYGAVTSGSVIRPGQFGNDSDNAYSSEVGTTVETDIASNELLFRHYVDDRGGVWNIKVDGIDMGNFSTHINEHPNEDSLISDVLTDGIHHVVMEFLGDDPNNPPSSGAGTARGWINHTEGTTSTQTTFKSTLINDSAEVVVGNSNKEFAFSVMPEGASTTEYIPEHNGVGTAYIGKTGYQKIYIDGVLLSDFTPSTDISFNEAKIIQKLECSHPEITSKIANLFIVTTINKKGVSITGKISWLTDVLIPTGYVNMFPLATDFAKLLVTSNGQKYDLTVGDAPSENIPDGNYGFIALDTTNNKDYYVFMQSNSPASTYRVLEEETRSTATPDTLVFLQHRDSTVQKIYPKVYHYRNVVAGDSYTFEGHFALNKQPVIGELLN